MRPDRLDLVSVTIKDANAFVAAVHRHHRPVTGHKFSLGAVKSGVLVGVAIVGRPVARLRDDGLTLEVTRLCTDGTKNACSFLYGAAARACFALGYKRIGTYTMPDEGGASLRAAGWKMIAETPGRAWRGLCVRVSDCEYIYAFGRESGLAVSLIKLPPRFGLRR